MADTAAPPNGLSKILSAKRRRGKIHSDSASGSTVDTESGSNKVRESLEGVVDKLRMHNESDEDDEVSGVKKLIPSGIANRRRRKRLEKEASEEAERGRAVANRGTLQAEDGSPGRRSLVHQYSEDGSSLITYDYSDTESPYEPPPPLSVDPSHAGYLTTSSPLVKASIIPQIVQPDDQLDGTAHRRPRTAKLAASVSTESLTLQAPSDGSQKRSPSPVGRLREAFKPKRGSTPEESPERKSGGKAGTLSKDKGGENARRGSVVSRIFDKQNSQPGSTNSSPERPRTGKVQPIDTNAVPLTPPPLPGDPAAPIIVNTPPTPTDSTAPRPDNRRDRGSSDPANSKTDVVVSPSGNMISHRRVRSGSAVSLGPSKLSNITSAPLTPLPENGTASPGQGGFFSTVFSAAQNAANQLSNSIANTSVAPGDKKNKSGKDEPKETIESPEVETLVEKTDPSINEVEENEPAVKTLGMGDLSLSHLGISDPGSGTPTPVTAKFPEEQRGRPELTREDSSNNKSAAFSGGEGNESAPTHMVVDDAQLSGRPRSTYEPSDAGGTQTPPNGSVFEGKTGVQRSGSIRSAIGGHRRKRNSSATTGASTIGAAIAAAHGSVADPKAGTPKITGFAVASKKRNRDYHQLFRSVPDDDYLIEDYSCALQREILAHGRLYVSEGHLCFSSNIFGWVTTLVMSFDEIVSVEKRSTALVFKNGLEISTLHAKHIFASFTSRDSTYDLIVGIWKLGHPSLHSSVNGVRIEGTGSGDKTVKDDQAPPPPLESQSASGSESEDEDGSDMYDEDDDDDGMSFTQGEGSVAGSDVADKVVSRKASAPIVTSSTTVESREEKPLAPAGDFPGPATHSPTNCSDAATHYPKILADEQIPAPLGKIYSMMFGTTSLTWMKNFFMENQKCFDLVMDGAAAEPLSLENKVRNYSYIKPLSGAIGPKQTKCICVETLESYDLEKAVSVTISTQNPDVPSGNVFSVKTRYCLSWGENNGTRVQVNNVIEWTGKSWLKGPIEKGANEGQAQYTKDILAALKAAVSSRRSATAATPGGKSKKKGRKGRESKSLNKTLDGVSDSKPVKEDWGILEPVHPILGPVVDIISPLITPNIIFGLFVGLLVAFWFRSGNGKGDSGLGFLGTPERIAAYEEIWRREESELWEWLEDRVGMDRLRDTSKMPVEARDLKDKLRDEKMEEREMDAAIRVTEEKLRVLKETVEREKAAAKKVVEVP